MNLLYTSWPATRELSGHLPTPLPRCFTLTAPVRFSADANATNISSEERLLYRTSPDLLPCHSPAASL